jgi:iron complex transport system substrate-binding protein
VDDDLAARAASGELAQIGYTWHQAPNLEVLVTKRPDGLLTRLVNLDHAVSLERSRALGIPVVPMFTWAEQTYLGEAEWIKLFGLLCGVEREANAYFDRIVGEVDTMRARAAQLFRERPTKGSVGVLRRQPAVDRLQPRDRG